MLRIISDYADAYAAWSIISSFGSIISVISTWSFLYKIYVQLTEGKATSKYPWLTPQFYYDLLQGHLFNSLKWALTSLVKAHSFISLPVQSNYFTDQWAIAIRYAISLMSNADRFANIGAILNVIRYYFPHLATYHPVGHGGVITPYFFFFVLQPVTKSRLGCTTVDFILKVVTRNAEGNYHSIDIAFLFYFL